MLPDKITTREHCNQVADELAKLEVKIAAKKAALDEAIQEVKLANASYEELKKDRKSLNGKLARFAKSKKGQVIFGTGYFKAITPLAEYGINIGSPLETIPGWDEDAQIKALRANGHENAILVIESIIKETVEKLSDEEKTKCGFVKGTSKTFFHKLRDEEKPDKNRTVTIPEEATA